MLWFLLPGLGLISCGYLMGLRLGGGLYNTVSVIIWSGLSSCGMTDVMVGFGCGFGFCS